jgi:hypothetical protein
MNGNKHPFEAFIESTTTKLRGEARRIAVYGGFGESIAATLAQAATVLEADFRDWSLAMLTIPEASAYCGYSEDGLRGMCQADKIPHSKGDGDKGHLRIARCHLPLKHGRVEEAALSLEEVRAKKLLGDRAA